jgi:hypothetical protein
MLTTIAISQQSRKGRAEECKRQGRAQSKRYAGKREGKGLAISTAIKGI